MGENICCICMGEENVPERGKRIRCKQVLPDDGRCTCEVDEVCYLAWIRRNPRANAISTTQEMRCFHSADHDMGYLVVDARPTTSRIKREHVRYMMTIALWAYYEIVSHCLSGTDGFRVLTTLCTYLPFAAILAASSYNKDVPLSICTILAIQAPRLSFLAAASTMQDFSQQHVMLSALAGVLTGVVFHLACQAVIRLICVRFLHTQPARAMQSFNPFGEACAFRLVDTLIGAGMCSLMLMLVNGNFCDGGQVLRIGLWMYRYTVRTVMLERATISALSDFPALADASVGRSTYKLIPKALPPTAAHPPPVMK